MGHLSIMSLEVQLEAELNDAFVTISGNLAIGSAGIGDADAVEVGVVEGVDRFAAELQVEAFRELEGAQQRQVPALEAGAADCAAALISYISGGNRVRKRSLIEPQFAGVRRSHVRVSDLIGTGACGAGAVQQADAAGIRGGCHG